MKWNKLHKESFDGWKLDERDITTVNDKDSGNHEYLVKLWWGSGYRLDCYRAYAFSEEEALNFTVAFIEKENPKLLQETDNLAKDLIEELMTDNGWDEPEAEDSPEFNETFMYVDATMEGADEPHYIWSENLAIVKKESFNESQVQEKDVEEVIPVDAKDGFIGCKYSLQDDAVLVVFAPGSKRDASKATKAFKLMGWKVGQDLYKGHIVLSVRMP